MVAREGNVRRDARQRAMRVGCVKFLRLRHGPMPSRRRESLGMRMLIATAMGWLLVLFLSKLVYAAPTTLPITQVCEERMNDDALAVVIPQRQELLCRSGGQPWGFCFAGFQ